MARLVWPASSLIALAVTPQIAGSSSDIMGGPAMEIERQEDDVRFVVVL